MKLRTALLGLFVITAVAVVALRQQLPSPWKVEARSTSTPVTESFEPPVPFSADSSIRFEVMRERALTPYRLRPDRRLALAVNEIRRLAGVRDSAVTATFAAGRWTFRCGTQELGKLSELPDFDDMLALLTEVARKQAWARGWSDNSGPERADLQHALDRVDAGAALREADRAWAAGAGDGGQRTLVIADDSRVETILFPRLAIVVPVHSDVQRQIRAKFPVVLEICAQLLLILLVVLVGHGGRAC